jgi:FkbM family methyltransferase
MRIRVISKVLWTLEYIFFYPKLKKALSRIKQIEGYDNLKNSVILDIGGHLGQTVKIFSKIFKNSNIYSFEPNPIIFKTLEKLNSKNIHCLNFGVGSQVCESDFFVSKFSETSSFNLPNPESKWNILKSKILGLGSTEMYKKIKIKVISVDFFVEQNKIPEIFLLKIDVEGSELEVLKGCIKSLTNKKIKYIQLEELRNDLYKDNSSEINELLNEVGMQKMYSIKHPVGNFYEHIYG